MSDYTKRISTYLDFPYGQGGETITIEEYEQLLLKHLASVKERATEWSNLQKDLTDIKVYIYIGHEGSYVVTEMSLIGNIPMTDAERAQLDEGKRIRAQHIANTEQQQLAYLLKKYPLK